MTILRVSVEFFRKSLILIHIGHFLFHMTSFFVNIIAIIYSFMLGTFAYIPIPLYTYLCTERVFVPVSHVLLFDTYLRNIPGFLGRRKFDATVIA